jgi:glycosyltransferase involved in cell wall biosynthesis
MWAAQGADVTVITGMPNHPDGNIHPGYRRTLRRTEYVDGYRIIRTWLYATPNEGFARKILSHISFALTSVLLGWPKSGRPDVVVVSSPTFFSIASAWVYARVKSSRFVVEVRDLWPAVFVDLGTITNARVIAALEFLELLAYKAADLIVVVTHGFRDHIAARGVSADKVRVIPNGVDLRRFDHPPVAAAATWRQAHGIDAGETVALYVGAHGISQNLSTVLAAAKKLESTPVRVVLVGDGAEKAKLRDLASELSLKRALLLDPVPSREVPTLLEAADVCLLPLRDVPLFKTFIPSKMFEYMAAGRAIVASLRGESADLIRKAGSVVIPPDDADALADALVQLSDRPEQRHERGVQGRAFVSHGYDRSSLAHEYLTQLQGVCDAV